MFLNKEEENVTWCCLIHSVRVEDQKPIQWLENFTVRQNTTPDNMLSTLLSRLTF